MVAFPLRIGAIWVGAFGRYRETPQPRSPAQLGDALLLADAATVVLLDDQACAAESKPGRSRPGGQAPDLVLWGSITRSGLVLVRVAG